MARYRKVDSVHTEGLWQNWLFYPTVVLVKKSGVQDCGLMVGEKINSEFI